MGGPASSAMPQLFSSQVLSLRTWTLLCGPANLSLSVCYELLITVTQCFMTAVVRKLTILKKKTLHASQVLTENSAFAMLML